jgi:hypothetical protein
MKVTHECRLFSVTVIPGMGDLFDFNNLLPELVVGLGLALILGNGLAWWKHRHGETPKGVEDAQYRGGRVAFLSVIGLVMTVWGLVSVLN